MVFTLNVIETKVESVQRWATKIIYGLKNLSYLDRLQAVNYQHSLFVACDVTYNDMILLLCRTTKLFSIDQRELHDRRGHNLKLKETRQKLNIRIGPGSPLPFYREMHKYGEQLA